MEMSCAMFVAAFGSHASSRRIEIRDKRNGTDVSLFSACRHLRHTKTMQHAANFRHGVSWLMSTCSFQGCQLMQLPDQVNHHQALAKTPNHITCVFAWVLCLLA